MPAKPIITIGTGDHAVSPGNGDLFLIAGPCVVESRDSVLRHAEAISRVCAEVNIPLIFKASYDKANRTSYTSYRGPGPEEGLKILQEVRDQLGLPVLTDVHEVAQVAPVADAVDVLQIPAFLCRQTDLIAAAASSGKPVNIKKGQFLAPWDMEHVLAKAVDAGGESIMLTERGTTFGYGNLVNDFRSLEIMGAYKVPVIFDATHSVQMPGGAGATSSGDRRFVAPLARAAVAVGVAGLFMEVHEDPDNALSDGPNSVPLGDLAGLLRSVLAIHATAKGQA